MSKHATLNKFYRLVWNATLSIWVAVAETARGRGKPNGRARNAAALVAAIAASAVSSAPTFAAPPVDALPSGGQVVAGQAVIGTVGSAMTIQQATQQAILNWNTFNIGQNASVTFNQPNAGSVALNRVTGTDASQIYGSLNANGQVFLVNPAGIVFGAGARVDVGSLVASTLGIGNADFLAGKYSFAGNGSAGSITNDGKISAGNGGYLAFLAPRIANSGELHAPQGTVALAAGNQVSLDFAGDKLINFTLDQGAVDALADNKGLIRADDGAVLLSARAADSLTQAVVNNSGVIEARGLISKGGRILLDSGAGGLTTLKGAGRLDTSSASAQGGDVTLLGKHVGLFDQASIDTSGETGGGTVLVGGNYQGLGPEPNAEMTFVDVGTRINADALSVGDGGKVVIWADDATRYRGSLTSRGGATGGNGGDVEISGKQNLEFNGPVDTSAIAGQGGTVLLDPSYAVINTDYSGVSPNNQYPYKVFEDGYDSYFTISAYELMDASNNAPIEIRTYGGTIDIDVNNLALGNAGGSASPHIFEASKITQSWQSNAAITVSSSANLTFDLGGQANSATPFGDATYNRHIHLNIATGKKFTINSTSGGVYTDRLYVYGAGGLIKTGAGTLLVASDWAYTGGTTISAGTLYVGKGTDVGTLGTGAVTNNSSLAFFRGNATYTFSNYISGSGAVYNSSYGLTILTGNNTYTGLTSIGRGTLQIGNGGSSGTLGSGPVYLNTYALTFNRSNDLTVNNKIYGTTGTLTKLGAGTLTLTGANTYSGLTTISAGTLSIGAGGTSGQLGSGGVTNNSALIFNRSDALTATNLISGTGTLEKLGTGTLTLTGANSYSGLTTISNGLLEAGHATALGNTTGATTVASGATLYLNNRTVAENISVTGRGYLNAAGAIKVSDTAGTSGTLTVTGTTTTTIKGDGSGTDSLNLGAIIINNLAGLTILGGTLNVTTGAISAAGANSALVVNTAGTVSLGTVGSSATTLTDVFLTTDSLALTGNIYGRGTLIIKPYTATTSIGLAGGAGTLNLDATELAYLQDGFASITFGSDTTTGKITVGDYTSTDPLYLDTRGDIELTGKLEVSAGNSLYLGSGNVVGGSVTDTGSGYLVADKLYVAGSSSFVLDHGSNNVGILASSTLGSFSYVDADALTIGSIYDVRSAQTVDGFRAIGQVSITAPGTLTLDQAVSTTLADNASALVLKGGRVINNVGANALVANTGTSRWLLWSTNTDPFDGSTGDSLNSLAYEFKQYGYDGSNLNAGGTGKDGLLFSYAPSALTIAASGSASKVYDGTTTFVGTLGATGTVDSDLAATTGSGVYDSKDVATASTITISGGALSGVTNSGRPVYGYTLANTGSIAGTITAAPLALSGLSANNKVYDGSTAASIGDYGTLSGFVGSETVSLVTTGASALFDNANVGTRTATVSGLDLSDGDAGGLATNYSVTAGLTAAADITVASITLTTSDVSKEYDGGLSASGTAAVSSGTLFSGDTLSGGTYAFTDKNAGDANKTVNVAAVTMNDGNSGNNYSISYAANTTSCITPKALILSGLSANNKIYDANTDATLANLGTLSGFVDSETVLLNSDSVSASFDSKNIGTGRTVTVSGLTLNDGVNGGLANNYSFGGGATATANITAKTLILSGFNADNKVYDGNTDAAISNAGSLDGVIGGEAVTVGNSGASFADKHVANNKTVTLNGVTLGGTDAGNYSIADSATDSANITQRTLTLTLSGQDKVYDSGTSATVTYADDRIAGDSFTVGHASAIFSDENVATDKAITVTDIDLTGDDANNYLIDGIDLFPGATLNKTTTATITAKPITVTGITAANKVYDATTAAAINSGSATLTSGANGAEDNKVYSGDTVSVDSSGASGSFADQHVATGKTVTINGLTLTGADAGNYSVSGTADSTADITTKAITVTAAAQSKTYGDADPTLSYSGSIALLGSDSYSGALGRAVGETVAGGPYTINQGSLTIADGNSGNNYSLSYVGDNLTIDQKTLTLSGFAAADKIYDRSVAATINDAGSLLGVVGSDTVTATNSGATFADWNAASGKLVTLAGVSLGGADAGNYSIAATTTDTAAISQKALGLSLSGQGSKEYDATSSITLSGATPSLTGIISGDTVDLGTGSVTGFVDKNVGTNKAVTFSGFAISGTDFGNYSLTSGSAASTADITAKAISLTGFTAADKVYNTSTAATISNTGSLVGVFTGDVVSATNSGATFADKNVATNKTVTLNGISLGDSDGGNYSIASTATATADISQKAISLSGLSAQDKIYNQLDGATLSGTGVLTNGAAADDDNKFYTGDGVSLAGSASGSFADKHVGTDKTVTISGLTLAGDDLGNYSLNAASVTASITPKAITASGITAANKEYDTTRVAALNTSVAALTNGAGADNDNNYYSGDDLTLVSSAASGSFADKNVADSKAVTVTGLSLSGSDAGNYSVTDASGATANITAKAITLDGFAAADKVYDRNVTATISNAGSLTGVFAGDSVSVANGGATFADWNAASGKTVTLNGITLGSTDAANYSIASTVTDTADISKKALGLDLDGQGSKIYDATSVITLVDVTPTLTGVIGSDDVTLDAGAVTGFADKNAGSNKAVTFSGFTLSNTDAGNYSLTSGSAASSANITARPMNVVADAQTKIYGNADPALSYVTETASASRGLVSGDSLSGALARAAGENVGVYAIDQGTLDNANYAIAFTGSDLTIGKRDITLAANTVSKVEGNPDPNLSVSIVAGSLGSVSVSDALADVSGTLGRQAGESIGKYDVLLGSGSKAGNYTIVFASDNQAFGIDARPSAPVIPPPPPPQPPATPTPTEPPPVFTPPTDTGGTGSGGTDTTGAGGTGTGGADTTDTGGTGTGGADTTGSSLPSQEPGGGTLGVNPNGTITVTLPDGTQLSGLGVPGITFSVVGNALLISSKTANADTSADAAPGGAGLAGTSVSTTMSVVIIRKGQAPVAEKGFVVEQGRDSVSLVPLESASAANLSAPGRELGSISFVITDEDGKPLRFKAVLTETGLVIQPQGASATKLAEGRRDLVVGLALAELQKQLKVAADQVRSVFLEL